MKVYIVYNGNGYTYSPPLKVFSSKEAAEKYREKNSNSYVEKFQVHCDKGENNV